MRLLQGGAILITLLMSVISLYLFIITFSEWSAWRALEENGILEAAVIRTIEEQNPIVGGTAYTVTFDYVVPSGVLTAEQTIHEALYSAIASKSEISVLTEAGNRERVRIVGSKPNFAVRFIYSFCAFIAAIIGWLLYELQVARLSKRLMLLSGETPLSG